MKVLNHRLHQDDDTPVPFERSPNVGGQVEHEYLVMHFTAGPSAASSIGWLTNPASRASAHVVIGRDGGITQLVPFDRVAWHAGVSAWDGREGLNRYSLGIELDNAGPLTLVNGQWQAWFGTTYPDEEVLVATHKHESAERGWHLFTTAQLEAAAEVATLLVTHYDLLDVVGHDDIAPHRKVDPGPAFPMRSFQARVMGRSDDAPPAFETTAHLNIRTGPGTQHEKLEGSPLLPETRVEVLDTHAQWRFVDVLDEIGDVMDLQGWVHGRYLRRMG